MKGILLAGGKGTRLYPLTFATCKQLLPVYDKPMIYYPLAVLVAAGISEILIICNEEDLSTFQKLLGDGLQWGLSLEYAVQEEPRGIAEALIIGEAFIGSGSVALILGDNIFYGENLGPILQRASNHTSGALVFGYEVENPSRYGVFAFDEERRVIDIVEKPVAPPSQYAVTGLYFYDSNAPEMAKRLCPSLRGELEITDLNRAYLERGTLSCQLLGRGFAWLDTGTPDSLLSASHYIQTIQERQGIKIGCVEEAAYQQGFIARSDLLSLADKFGSSSYASYLRKVAEEKPLFLGLFC